MDYPAINNRHNWESLTISIAGKRVSTYRYDEIHEIRASDRVFPAGQGVYRLEGTFEMKVGPEFWELMRKLIALLVEPAETASYRFVLDPEEARRMARSREEKRGLRQYQRARKVERRAKACLRAKERRQRGKR